MCVSVLGSYLSVRWPRLLPSREVSTPTMWLPSLAQSFQDGPSRKKEPVEDTLDSKPPLSRKRPLTLSYFLLAKMSPCDLNQMQRELGNVVSGNAVAPLLRLYPTEREPESLWQRRLPLPHSTKTQMNISCNWEFPSWIYILRRNSRTRTQESRTRLFRAAWNPGITLNTHEWQTR